MGRPKKIVGSIKNKDKTTVTGLSESKGPFCVPVGKRNRQKILYVASNEYAALRAYEDFPSLHLTRLFCLNLMNTCSMMWKPEVLMLESGE